jgi:hypothetical protein
MQAIETKFLGPTNARGARVKASAEVGSVTVPWDHWLSTERNHDEAARALILKLGWYGTWVRGGRADSRGNVYVCAKWECTEGYRTPHPHVVDPDCLLIVREG